MSEINIVTIKWGKKYNYDYVNKLYRGILRNSSKAIKFYCFTENYNNIDDSIICLPLPTTKLEGIYENVHHNYCWLYKTAGLSKNNLADLEGKRVFFFDLDVIITGNLDSLFEYPLFQDFYIINDWNTNGDHVGQASFFSFVVGTLGYLTDDFEKNHNKIMQKYNTASQEYLSDMVVQKYGKLNFWPDELIRSFKYHCLPYWFLRTCIKPSIPNNSRIVVFHGNPNMEQAIEGVWEEDMPIYKKVYKNFLPCKWIENYWF